MTRSRSTPAQSLQENVAGIVLASGMSRRFGARNKLLVPVGGVPVVRRTVDAYLAGGLTPVLVVIGYEGDTVAAALDGMDIRTVENPDFRDGQSRALVRGIEALPEDVPAAVIGVADQPYLTGRLIVDLVSAWRAARPPAVAPSYQGERGNPVLYDRALFAELREVTGDQGGRPVFARHRDRALVIEVDDVRAGMDIDTVDDWEGLAQDAE